MGGVGGSAGFGGAPAPRWLAFSAGGGAKGDLYAVDTAGPAPWSLQQLTPAPNGAIEKWAWSPDGRRIAYVVTHDVSKRELFIVEIGPTGFGTPIALGAAHNSDSAIGASPFVWSPDGSKLAFESASGISVVDVTGSAPASILEIDMRGIRRTWSPDGKWLSFTYEQTCGNCFKLFAVEAKPAATPFEISIYPNGENEAIDSHWSPDSQRIAFVDYPEGFELPNGNVYVVDVSSQGVSQPVAVTPPSGVVSWGSDEPAWAFDASYLAFRFFGSPPGSDLCLSNVSSGAAWTTVCVSGFGSDKTWKRLWSPIAAKLAFVADDAAGLRELWLVDAASPTQPIRVSGAQQEVTSVRSWSADGRYLAYAAKAAGGTRAQIVDVSSEPPGAPREIECDGAPYSVWFSPDSKWVAPHFSVLGNESMCWAELDGSGTKKLTSKTKVVWNGWSPDSKWFAARGDLETAGIERIYVVDPQSASTIAVTNAPNDVPELHDAVWQP